MCLKKLNVDFSEWRLLPLAWVYSLTAKPC